MCACARDIFYGKVGAQDVKPMPLLCRLFSPCGTMPPNNDIISRPNRRS